MTTEAEVGQDVIPIIRPWVGEEEAQAAADVIRSGWLAQGPRVAALETAFAEMVGAPHAVALSNCTTALHLALVAAGVGPGDEVVVPSFSFIATTNAVLYVGATPVFADVELDTGNLSVASVEPRVTPRTAAIIVVDQGGVPADIDAFRAAFGDRLVVIEDAACAAGSTYRGAPVGGRAELTAFSFHPRKLVTAGEGGMLVLHDRARAERVRRLREHGMSVSAAERHRSGGLVFETYLETGFNYRMTDVQAAVTLVQLGKLPAIVRRRRALAQHYRAAFADLAHLRTVTDPPWGTTNFQSFWVLLGDGCPVSRNELIARCAAAGVATRRGIMAAHLEPACERFASSPLPNTERLTRDSLILPLYHDLAETDQCRVIEVIRDACG